MITLLCIIRVLVRYYYLKVMVKTCYFIIELLSNIDLYFFGCLRIFVFHSAETYASSITVV